MLSQDQKQEFHQNGYIRITNSFSVDDARPMRELIFDELERQCGIDRNDSSTWHSAVWPKFQNIKFDPVFDPIGGKVTRAVLDELLDEWETPSNWGQFLVSFPTAEEWKVPHQIWHTDFGFETAIDPLPGVLLVSFITDVGPRSGGTAAIEGGHHLLEKFVESKTPDFRKKMRRVRESFMESDPWLKDLANQSVPDREQRFIRNKSTVKGCPVRVCELTGNTGDIVIGHPWLLHTFSQNCGTSISMRRVQRIHAKRLETTA